MKSKLALLAFALGLIAVGPVWAGSVNFDFSNCNSIVSAVGPCPGDLGTSTAAFTDTTGTYFVLAGGVDYSFNGIDLFVKNSGGSENGLGLAGTVNNEINSSDTGQAIILDMADLAGSGLDSGSVVVGSLQAGESGTVCNLAALETCQTVVESGNTEMGTASVSWSASDPYLVFWQPNVDGGNFLVDTMTVPEPGSALLFAFGLVGIILVVARRKGALGR